MTYPGKTELLPQYGGFIPGIFPKCFHIMKEVQIFQCKRRFERWPLVRRKPALVFAETSIQSNQLFNCLFIHVTPRSTSDSLKGARVKS